MKFIKWLGFFKKALITFNKSDGWAMASHVSLSLMIAVFPFLIFSVSLAGTLDTAGISENIIKLIFDYWPDAIAEPIIHEIRSVVTTSNTKILTAGFLIAMFFSSNGIEAIRVALNRAYGGVETRSLWKLRLQSLQFVLVGAILMIFISVFLVFVPLYFSFVESNSPVAYDFFYRSDYPSWVSALGLLMFFVYACHHWLPGRTRSIKKIWPGIFLTLTLWIIATTFFSLYLKSFANYNATYAGLAGITTAMIFLYLMSAILIFGAEYNSALEKEELIAN